MKLRNLKFALNSAWQSFWRNLAVSMAAVVSITLILILAGVNLLVGHAFSQVLDSFRAKVSEISINVADDTPLQTVYDFQQQLSLDPRVTHVMANLAGTYEVMMVAASSRLGADAHRDRKSVV